MEVVVVNSMEMEEIVKVDVALVAEEKAGVSAGVEEEVIVVEICNLNLVVITMSTMMDLLPKHVGVIVVEKKRGRGRGRDYNRADGGRGGVADAVTRYLKA
ncbi:hypothetical protein MKX03_037059 [Papaver bracteatum]|nr:hypothetical protein MKX03_037059 [Papaver bracteatum]